MARIDPLHRFQLLRDEGGLATAEVGTFPTFTEAEAYRDALGDKVSHVRLNIIDRAKNIITDAADSTEQESLNTRMALAQQRAQLLALEEQNFARESAIKVPGLVTR